MSLTISGILDKTNISIPVLEERQDKKKLRLDWDTLPEGARIFLYFKNGLYAGVENKNGEIKVFYTGRIAGTESGETFFGAISKDEERSITKYEMEK